MGSNYDVKPINQVSSHGSRSSNRSMPLQIQLSARPGILPLYLRALTARKQGVVTEEGGPILASATLKGQNIDPTQLREYREVCGFAASAQLPATYLFVLAMPLQLELLVSEAFPFPVMGVVHVRNRISQYRPLLESQPLDIQCDLAAPVAVKRGYEFDLVTRVYIAGELVWDCVSTLLSRVKHQSESAPPVAASAKKSREYPAFDDGNQETWEMPADTGRRYARVSGDGNPIHLSAPTAKLFGFPRAIAHGMWTKARCIAALEADRQMADQFRIEVTFIRPILLPAKVGFLARPGDKETEFSVQGGGGKRLHLIGRVAYR